MKHLKRNIIKAGTIFFVFSGFVSKQSASIFVNQVLRVMQIDLMPSKGSIVHGTVLFKENMDHSAYIVITIRNTKKDSTYLSQINNGSIESPGFMAMAFPVMKGSGSFATQIIFNIKAITDASCSMMPLTYDDLIKFPGYVSIQIARLSLNKLMATGNINQHLSVITEVNKHLK